MDLTSGRWLRWVARYEKGRGGGGGGAILASGPIRKVGGSPLQVRYTKSGGGKAIRFRSDTKSGG